MQYAKDTWNKYIFLNKSVCQKTNESNNKIHVTFHFNDFYCKIMTYLILVGTPVDEILSAVSLKTIQPCWSITCIIVFVFCFYFLWPNTEIHHAFASQVVFPPTCFRSSSYRCDVTCHYHVYFGRKPVNIIQTLENVYSMKECYPEKKMW